jgi:predicted protein tyrosine phosphatase
MDVEALLSRLSGLRKAGADKWQAKCPAHDDRSPSLAIRQLDDGRILIHCFAGCGASDVVAAVGLEVSDLFPERLGEFKRVRHPFSAADALRALRRESGIVAMAAADVAEGKPIDDQERIALAAERIADALEYVDG